MTVLYQNELSTINALSFLTNGNHLGKTKASNSSAVFHNYMNSKNGNEPSTPLFCNSKPMDMMIKLVKNSSWASLPSSISSSSIFEEIDEDNENESNNNNIDNYNNIDNNSCVQNKKRHLSVSFHPEISIQEFVREPNEKDCSWYTKSDIAFFSQQTLVTIVQYDRECKAKLQRQRNNSCDSTKSIDGVHQKSNSCNSISTESTSSITSTSSGSDQFKQPLYRTVFGYNHQKATKQNNSHSYNHMNKYQRKKPFYCHPALQPDYTLDRIKFLCAKHEIQNILIVDSHDLCCRLLAKSLYAAWPHVKIMIAKSSNAAMRIREKYPKIDLMIVEERLHLFHRQEQQAQSGSELVRIFSENNAASKKTALPLIIGISAHLNDDAEKLKSNGADLIWQKPPPPFHNTPSVLENVLQKLLIKRGKQNIIPNIF